jgi:uncharacterized protein (DUF1778 family)
MLPEMLAYDMTNTGMFYDFETKVVLQSTVEEYPEVEAIELSEEDFNVLADAIENPPEPNPALKALLSEPHPSIGPIKRRI